MMAVATIKSPSQLVSEINTEHDQVETHKHNAVVHALRCGDLLREVKERLQHGEWLPWLDKHFTASERTAQTYMRISEEVERNPKLVADLTGVKAAGRLLAQPAPEKPPQPKDENTRSMLDNLDHQETIDSTAVEVPPESMNQKARRKWSSCQIVLDAIRSRLSVTEEQSDESRASAFREASKKARSLAVELEGLAEAVESSVA